MELARLEPAPCANMLGFTVCFQLRVEGIFVVPIPEDFAIGCHVDTDDIEADGFVWVVALEFHVGIGRCDHVSLFVGIDILLRQFVAHNTRLRV